MIAQTSQSPSTNKYTNLNTDKYSPRRFVFDRAKIAAFLTCLSISLFVSTAISAQELPSEIRGYKVHREKIIVTNASGSFDAIEKRKASVVVGQPDIVDVSLTGITLSVPAVLNAVGQSGEVHFMSFHDFRVNEIGVDIEDYKERFSFKKNEKIALPKPATIFLPTGRILTAAWEEISNSKKEWTVTGRIFVFGKFKKFGFVFKRVVPVDIGLTIKNPLQELR
jgi:hypothetical protein